MVQANDLPTHTMSCEKRINVLDRSWTGQELSSETPDPK